MSSSLTITSPKNLTPEMQTPSKSVPRAAFASVVAIFRKVRRVGKKIGEAQARALMYGFYYAVLGPFFFIAASRRNPLGIDLDSAPTWRKVSYRRAADHNHQQY